MDSLFKFSHKTERKALAAMASGGFGEGSMSKLIQVACIYFVAVGGL